MNSVPPPNPLPIVAGELSGPLAGTDVDDFQPMLAVPEVSNDLDETTADTPVLMKASLQPEVHGGLSQERIMTMREIGSHIKQIPVESFLKNFLPRLHQNVNLDSVINHLKTTGENPILTRSGWTDLLLNQHLHEDNRYKPLASIVPAIIAAGSYQSGRMSVLKYVQWPRRPVYHRYFPNTGLPDGYGYIDDPANPNPHNLYWHQIIFSAQFKKVAVEGESNDNNRQLCNDMAQIMRDDPTRRFCYGYTLEYDTMKLWYFDRSELVVSDEFNHMTDPRSFIHFILSLALSASPWDIGMDTTMVRRVDSNGQFFDITVNDKKRGVMKYRTQKNVHYFQAEAPRGRCTRVWQVRKLGGVKLDKPEGKVVVLKDTWIDHDRDREGAIMEAMVNDLTTPEDKEALRRVLLTTLCHGDVRGPDDQTDSTRVVLSDHFYVLKQETVSDRNAHARSTSSLTQSGAYYGNLPNESAQSGLAILLDPKTHYRIVFEEVGLPLDQMDNLEKAFKALYHISRGLGLMHSANWVHRDISAHNIIWYEPRDGSRPYAKLCDLEYAKRDDDKRSHIVRSGSNFYMPWEVVNNDHRVLYSERLSPSSPPAADNLNATFDARHQPSSQSTTASEAIRSPVSSPEPEDTTSNLRERTFKYNALHDLESLWWIAVYFLFYKEVFAVDLYFNPKPLQRAYRLAHQQEMAKKLFHCQHTPGSSRQEHYSEREWTFYMAGRFKQHVDALLPSAVRPTGHEMNNVRISLLQFYTKINQDLFPRLSPDDKAEIRSIVTGFFEKAYTSPKLAKSLHVRPHLGLKYELTPIPQPGNTADTVTRQMRFSHVVSRTRTREDSDDTAEDSDDTVEDPDKVRAVKRRKTNPS